MRPFWTLGLLTLFAVTATGTAAAPAARSARAVAALSGPMVSIPGGVLQMGDTTGHGQAKEKPVHPVTIKPFEIGKYEVTVGQFKSFVAATRYRTEAEQDPASKGCASMDIATDKWVLAGRTWREPGYPQTDSFPVACINWNDAQAYIAWLNGRTGQRFRLPTEAEWEWAARGGTDGDYFWGPELAKGCDYANGADLSPWPNGGSWNPISRMECRDGVFYASPVGRFKPNPYGLHDIVGNLWEWVEDCWHPTYAGAPADGRAWSDPSCSSHVSRGGSWHSGRGLRISGREWGQPARLEYGNQGFRLARDR